MLQFEIISFVFALVLLQVTIVLYIWGFISRYYENKAGRSTEKLRAKKPLFYALPVLFLSWIALSFSLIVRALIIGDAPFTDMYGFASSFCWGVIFVGILFQWRLRSEVFGAGASLIAICLLLYAFSLPFRQIPLPAVLRQTWLLPLHVSCAIMAYGMFALGFISAILYILRKKYSLVFLPTDDLLDRAGQLSVLTGFTLMTLVIIIGSIWANMAWGSYWNWDPKETASLVTWLIYATYLATRFLLQWKNERSAILLIAGFIAVLVTFFGNLFFGGLHSYAA